MTGILDYLNYSNINIINIYIYPRFFNGLPVKYSIACVIFTFEHIHEKRDATIAKPKTIKDDAITFLILICMFPFNKIFKLIIDIF